MKQHFLCGNYAFGFLIHDNIVTTPFDNIN